MSYGELNLFFLVIAGIAAWVLKKPHQPIMDIALFAVMMGLTAAFDNLIVYWAIVGYDYAKLNGIFVGVVPIEDFAYTIVAVLLIPAIWKALDKK